ncbi:MAG: DUF4360 domain-containing protein [Polyangia bacterium]
MGHWMMQSFRFSVLATAICLGSTTLAHESQFPIAPSTPDPNTIYIEQVTVNGTGCPAGTVAANFTPDYSILELTFSDFVAQIGPGTQPADWRKNCIVAVTLHLPAGYTFALIGADYNGYAQVDPHVTGMQQTSYFIAGMQGKYTLQSHIPQDLDANGNYSRNDEIPVADYVWANCGVDSIANLNASISLNNSQNRQGYGVITLDELDIGPQVLFHWHFAWQHC